MIKAAFFFLPMPDTKIKLLLIDDHKLVTDTWSAVFEATGKFTVQGTATNAGDALQLVTRTPPEVVLCDINMLPVDGIEITKKIKELSPSSKIIGVSLHSSPAFAKRMIQAGASGYVTKNSSMTELQRAILEVHAGRKYICLEIKTNLMEQHIDSDEEAYKVRQLTKKELLVIDFLKKGLSSKEIALEMDISLKTVEVHRYNMLKKLGLRNTASLINFIHRNGL